MNILPRPHPRLGLLVLALALGCHSPASSSRGPGQRGGPSSPEVLPLTTSLDVLKTAQTCRIPAAEAIEFPGLLNVFHLGQNLITGSEPQGRPALEALAAMGVKTILSVDGKTPDAQAAAELGMRYVHIPIQYSGIEDTQMRQLAKTFRELEAPFFVHCFHGKHRGPAAAAVGRVVLDGIPRQTAMAEMHQWSGTSLTYEGLFHSIAFQSIPNAQSTHALDFDFPAAHAFQGFRATMVPMARGWDEIKHARKHDWQPDPTRPDISPAQEALQVAQVFAQCQTQPDLPADTDQVRDWLTDGQQAASNLARILAGQETLAAEGIDWRQQAEDAYRTVANSCFECHSEYRN